MGGFEGGDEAGFWEEPQLLAPSKKSHQPQHVIDYEDGQWHLTLPDYQVDVGPDGQRAFTKKDVGFVHMSIVPAKKDSSLFNGVESRNEIALLKSCYDGLLEHTADSDIEEFFQDHCFKIALNGGVDDDYSGALCAGVMLLIKEACSLVITLNEMESILKDIACEAVVWLYGDSSAQCDADGHRVKKGSMQS